jgi:hypothetical protein
MDLSYALIPNPDGKLVKILRQTFFRRAMWNFVKIWAIEYHTFMTNSTWSTM